MHAWYVARYKSGPPWRRYIVVRWDEEEHRLIFANEYGDRAFFLSAAAAEHQASFLNWRDDFHEREVRYDGGT